MGQIARCFYYFFMIVVVIRYKTKATARRALTFVRIFVNDTIAIAVWTSFHVCASKSSAHGDDARPPLASWEDRKLSQSRLVALAIDWATLTSQSSVLLLKSCNTLIL